MTPPEITLKGAWGTEVSGGVPQAMASVLNFSVSVCNGTLLGYTPFCPRPSEPDDYTWCCTLSYMGTWAPSCCATASPGWRRSGIQEALWRAADPNSASIKDLYSRICVLISVLLSFFT